MSEDNTPTGEAREPVAGDALISGLSVVESQPLEQRAEGYVRLYDELRKRLESDDVASA